jgi:hypothetical protein
MRLLIAIIIALAVLYPTIWGHEVGHGVAPYLYGCKKTFWRTNTSWFLLSSWAGKDIDYKCMHRHGHAALAWGAFGGVAVNLLFLFILIPALRLWHTRVTHSWWFVALFFWALANYAEAFSYLVLNTAWLKSDMKALVMESGINRWILFVLGLLLAVAMAWMLRPITQKTAAMLAAPKGPERPWRLAFLVYVVVVAGAMAAARAALT